MIDIVYTGDIRFNQEIARKNHNLFFDELSKITKFEVHQFTNDVIKQVGFRGCPFDTGGKDKANVGDYRRGQGGGVQTFQLIEAMRITKNPFLIKMRTDNWFTKSSIDVLIKEIQNILNGKQDVSYFGSNWLYYIGVEDEKVLASDRGSLKVIKRVEDFIIVLNKSKTKSYDTVLNDMIESGKQKYNNLRSGNKCFRKIIDKDTLAYNHYCQMYLIRKHYDNYPTDQQVCFDYLKSYGNEKGKDEKMIPAWNWYENKIWQ